MTKKNDENVQPCDIVVADVGLVALPLDLHLAADHPCCC